MKSHVFQQRSVLQIKNIILDGHSQRFRVSRSFHRFVSLIRQRIIQICDDRSLLSFQIPVTEEKVETTARMTHDLNKSSSTFEVVKPSPPDVLRTFGDALDFNLSSFVLNSHDSKASLQKNCKNQMSNCYQTETWWFFSHVSSPWWFSPDNFHWISSWQVDVNLAKRCWLIIGDGETDLNWRMSGFLSLRKMIRYW